MVGSKIHSFYSKITALNISFVSLLINSVFAVEEKEYRNIPNLPARTLGTLQVTGFVQQNQNQTYFFPCLDRYCSTTLFGFRCKKSKKNM
jgi:hypothetical protein